MGESKNRVLQALAVCVSCALAAGSAALLYHAVSDYTTYYPALKVYSIAWFAAGILSFYGGLLVVPRSLGIIFSFAGVVAFGILCALDQDALSVYPIIGPVIQMLPAILFLFAWALIAIAACRSQDKKIRLGSWLWLAIFLILLFNWSAFHFAQGKLLKQRNVQIHQAREKTLQLVEKLEAYKKEKGVYPDTLPEAGIADEVSALNYRNKRIKYFGHGSDFVLTFEDPLLGSQQAFSYDTTQNGWFPADPKDAADVHTDNLFLNFLRQR